MERKIISHRRGVKFHKQYFIFDVYFFCAFCNRLSDKPFPRVDNGGFVVLVSKPDRYSTGRGLPGPQIEIHLS